MQRQQQGQQTQKPEKKTFDIDLGILKTQQPQVSTCVFITIEDQNLKQLLSEQAQYQGFIMGMGVTNYPKFDYTFFSVEIFCVRIVLDSLRIQYVIINILS